MRHPGRPSFDTSTIELFGLNLVSQHDETSNQYFSSHGDFRFGRSSTMQQAQIKALQGVVVPDHNVSRLNEQEPEQSRSCLADAQISLFISRRAFHRLQADVGHHTREDWETGSLAESVCRERQRGEQAHSRLRAHQPHPRVSFGSLLQPLFGFEDPFPQLIVQPEQFLALPAQGLAQRQPLAPGLFR